MMKIIFYRSNSAQPSKKRSLAKMIDGEKLEDKKIWYFIPDQVFRPKLYWMHQVWVSAWVELNAVWYEIYFDFESHIFYKSCFDRSQAIRRNMRWKNHSCKSPFQSKLTVLIKSPPPLHGNSENSSLPKVLFWKENGRFFLFAKMDAQSAWTRLLQVWIFILKKDMTFYSTVNLERYTIPKKTLSWNKHLSWYADTVIIGSCPFIAAVVAVKVYSTQLTVTTEAVLE